MFSAQFVFLLKLRFMHFKIIFDLKKIKLIFFLVFLNNFDILAKNKKNILIYF